MWRPPVLESFQRNRLLLTSGIRVSCHETPVLKVQSADFILLSSILSVSVFSFLAFTCLFSKHMSLLLFLSFPSAFCRSLLLLSSAGLPGSIYSAPCLFQRSIYRSRYSALCLFQQLFSATLTVLTVINQSHANCSSGTLYFCPETARFAILKSTLLVPQLGIAQDWILYLKASNQVMATQIQLMLLLC